MPWDVAEGVQVVVGVHQAALVVLVEVHRGSRRRLFAAVRVQYVVIGDREEAPEERSHGPADRVTVGAGEREREGDGGGINKYAICCRGIRVGIKVIYGECLSYLLMSTNSFSTKALEPGVILW